MEGIYGIYHIIYLIIALVLIIGFVFFIKIKKIEGLALKRILKIWGIVWLISILINRFSVTYYDVVINKREGYTWLNLIPYTYCGLCSLVLSITLICGKYDHFLFHSLGYYGLAGGLITMFYPDFLESQTFFDSRSLSGLVHHSLMFGAILILILTKQMIPRLKKWWYLPLGLCGVMTLGLVEMEALGFPKAMQINEPLLKSLPILTSWYIVDLVLIIVQIIFLIIYERCHRNHPFEEQHEM